MIGKKRHRIIFQEEVRTPDAAGGYSSAWQDIESNPTVWAQIAPVSGTDVLRFGQLQQIVTHRITIRYRSDITPDLRIVKGNRIFQLRAVLDPAESREMLEILAEERLFT